MQELLSLAAVVGTLAIGCRHTLSASAPRRAHIGCKTFVDRTARVVMLGLGLKLIAVEFQKGNP